MKCLHASVACRAIGLLVCVALAPLVLGGCAHLFHRSVVGDVAPVRVPPPPPPVPDGSIFQASRGRSGLFEDQRPQQVGDLLTIVFDEQVSASRNSQTDVNRKAGASFSPSVLPKGLTSLSNYKMDINGEHSFKGGGSSQAGNTFTGTLTVTVTQVLGNGNLRVRGEKQIAINSGTEFIRFAGTVDPQSISAENTVLSSRVADARIDYVGDGYISTAQKMGWLQRILIHVWPF